MKISYNWLREYIQTDIIPARAAEILTDIGLEVESLERISAVRGSMEGVVVGHVLTCERHPDADKLSVTTVDTGAAEPLQIVCGAPNVAAGQKVLVATINTMLYPAGSEEGFKIKRSKIRGVESLGMICAADELGLGEDHSGIMVLPGELSPGTPAKEALGIEDDWLLEIGLTPNRVDAASHYGVARDLYAFLLSQGEKATLSLPDTASFKTGDNRRAIMVEVQNPSAAPRYAGVTVTGVKIGPSPEWFQKRLRSIGLNPKNNVVDITNFVLNELGQPLHAFDADKIAGGRIVVRNCPEGTPFTTLDGVQRKLSAQDLAICDASGPMCIAGVMGGLESGVTEGTQNIFIESAYFNPVSVRKTAKRHGLNTDSSFRFERGTDPNMVIRALERAAILVAQLAGGEVSSAVTDIYPEPIAPFHFDVSFEKIDSLIGKKIGRETILKIIEALEIKLAKEDAGILSVAVPPYRVDVKRDVDLIEDILRIYGYNNVEVPQSVRSTLTYAPKPDKDKVQNLLSDQMTSLGFTEIMGNSLTSATYYDGLESYPAEKCVKILNPLSGDLNVMRQTLLFNALEAVQLNVNRRRADLKLYEFGNCYAYDASKASQGSLAAYVEGKRLSITVTGLAATPSWNVPSQASDLFSLEAIVQKILSRVGIDRYKLQGAELQSDIFAQALSLRQGDRELLRLGAVSRKLRAAFDIKAEVYYAEVDFDMLLKIAKNHSVKIEELSKFPEVKRDLALLVDKTITFEELRREAFAAERKMLTGVTLFDVYEGDKLPEGKKSYALGFTIEDRTHTLTDKEIDRVMASITSRLEKLGAAVRS